MSAFTHIYTKDCYPSNNENSEWFPHSKDSGLWRVCGCSTQWDKPRTLLCQKTRVHTEGETWGRREGSPNRREPTAKYKRDDGIRKPSFCHHHRNNWFQEYSWMQRLAGEGYDEVVVTQSQRFPHRLVVNFKGKWQFHSWRNLVVIGVSKWPKSPSLM